MSEQNKNVYGYVGGYQNTQTTVGGFPNNPQMLYQQQMSSQISQQYQQQMPVNIPNQQFQYYQGQYQPQQQYQPQYPGQQTQYPGQQLQIQNINIHQHSFESIKLTPYHQCTICKKNGNNLIGYNCTEYKLEICSECYEIFKC